MIDQTSPDRTSGEPAAEEPTPTSVATGGRLPDPVRRITEFVFYGSISWLAWFWVAAVVLWIGSLIVAPRIGDLETSTWEFFGLGWLRWVQFAAGCVLAYSSFPMLVAQGLTRRRVAQGSLVGIGVLGAVGAAVITAVYVVEGIVFSVLDIDHVVSEHHLFDVPGQWWWVAVESFLVYAVYMASGWFIALGFYRWNTVAGVLLIVPGLVPIVVVESALSSSILPENIEEVITDVPVAAAVLIAFATFAVTAAVTSRIMRDTPLRSRPR